MPAPVAGGPGSADGLEFHHLGVACRDLDREAAGYAVLGYRAEHEDFVDPVQGVRGRFLVGGGPRLELLVALPGHQVLDPWLSAGSRVYHQAYTTADLDGAHQRLRAAGARTVVPPVPAVAFGGRRICFVVLRTMVLVELVEVVDNASAPPAGGR